MSPEKKFIDVARSPKFGPSLFERGAQAQAARDKALALYKNAQNIRKHANEPSLEDLTGSDPVEIKKVAFPVKAVAFLAITGSSVGIIACSSGGSEEQTPTQSPDTPVPTQTIEPTPEITATLEPTPEPTEKPAPPMFDEVKSAVIAAYNSVGAQFSSNSMTKLGQCNEESLPDGIDYSSFVLNSCGSVAGDMTGNVFSKITSDEQAQTVNFAFNLLERFTYWKVEDHLERGIISQEQADNSYLLIEAAGWFAK